MPSAGISPAFASALSRGRAEELFADVLATTRQRVDTTFLWLMLAQWVCAAGFTLAWSPRTWTGGAPSIHPHVWFALFGGGLLTLPVVALVRREPGATVNRYAIAVAQMLWSALLIHLTGGRLETHFHIFVSLAILASYRDWKVLLLATLTVGLDHLLRGAWSPLSVYGVADPEWWRFLEHAVWIVFEDLVLARGIVEARFGMFRSASRQAALEALNATVEERVALRTFELQQSRERYQALLESTRTIPWELSEDLARFTYVGPQCAALLGLDLAEWLAPGFWAERVHPEDLPAATAHWQRAQRGGKPEELELRLRREEGTYAWVRCMTTPHDGSSRAALRGVMLDVTERRKLEQELQGAQKLQSVGRLAAGIAHEINTPLQFVGDSMHFVGETAGSLLQLVERLHALFPGAGTVTSAAARTEAERLLAEADLGYLNTQLPDALESCADGLARVTGIVRSMRDFAHPEQPDKVQSDLNRALEATLIISRHEYRGVAEVQTELDPGLPSVPCHVGSINQVFLNLIVNAAHAIADRVSGRGERGLICVVSRREGDDAVVSISDNGAGIPEAIRSRIFEPFFTTKDVGRGSGQGLAISRSVVVDKHGGAIEFAETPGGGTTFTVRLPIDGKRRAVDAAA